MPNYLTRASFRHTIPSQYMTAQRIFYIYIIWNDYCNLHNNNIYYIIGVTLLSLKYLFVELVKPLSFQHPYAHLKQVRASSDLCASPPATSKSHRYYNTTEQLSLFWRKPYNLVTDRYYIILYYYYNYNLQSPASVYFLQESDNLVSYIFFFICKNDNI